MRIARFTTGDEPRYAIVQQEGDRTFLAVLTGDPLYMPTTPTGERLELGDGVRLLAPVIPRSKVVAVGKNYADHAAEMGGDVPSNPCCSSSPTRRSAVRTTRSSCPTSARRSATRPSWRSSSDGSPRT
ncbi:hypothetical protein GCM10025864_31080 [Luteimicrobium album]|uniref:Rv2993c-like N-terminal domain-containing protein n=1 Tax=Luteimicrobium album TaxID=1054550 RepID=A0ABQ6I5W5_9MICO|nr:hypothetical protein GCM10025864_31080 [Luteimicrobium album]